MIIVITRFNSIINSPSRIIVVSNSSYNISWRDFLKISGNFDLTESVNFPKFFQGGRILIFFPEIVKYRKLLC